MNPDKCCACFSFKTAALSITWIHTCCPVWLSRKRKKKIVCQPFKSHLRNCTVIFSLISSSLLLSRLMASVSPLRLFGKNFAAARATVCGFLVFWFFLKPGGLLSVRHLSGKSCSLQQFPSTLKSVGAAHHLQLHTLFLCTNTH